MAAEIAFLLLLMLLAYWIVTGLYYRSRAKFYRKTAQLERTRSRWAESRLALFDLARRGRLDVNSKTFRTLYPIQTYILRHVGDYESIARQLVEGGLGKPTSTPPPWLNEVESWPHEMVTVFEKMHRGILELLSCYEPGLWPRGRLRRSRILVKKGPVSMSARMTDEHTDEQPVQVVLENAKKRVEELESAAAGGGRDDSPGFMPAYG